MRFDIPDDEDDPDEPSLEERTIARLQRNLDAALAAIAALRTACTPIIAHARDIHNDGRNPTTSVSLTLGQCRAIAAAFPP